MIFTPILWIEIGLAVLIGIVFLWTKVEFALFLYALALGFPDFAYPLGSTINIRLDDVLILLLLARIFLWTPVPLSKGQKNICTWLAIFFAVCMLSVVAGAAQGTHPEGYANAKVAGCAIILLVLPRIVVSRERLRFFLAGLMIGGIALVIQVYLHLGENLARNIANFQQMKDAATFTTWNPNTIGQAAVLLAFAAALGGITFSGTLAGKIIWPCLTAGFALVPAVVFVRGTTMSIAAGFVLFLCMVRRWKVLVLFGALCLSAVLLLHSLERPLVEEATSVNVSTGEGFSHRFDRWEMALQAIHKSPWLGQGFGQELNYLSLIGSEGRAHDAYLTVWIEMGLGGVLLFLAIIFQFARAGWHLFQNRQFQFQGALLVALIFTLSLDSLGLSTLYWEKLPTIALSLAIAVIGMCERDGQEAAAIHFRELAREPAAQPS